MLMTKLMIYAYDVNEVRKVQKDVLFFLYLEEQKCFDLFQIVRKSKTKTVWRERFEFQIELFKVRWILNK